MTLHSFGAQARLANLPAWVPAAARNYLVHTEVGLPIRELARQTGCHASTVLRQVRRFESRRDDPLIDAVLRKLGTGLKHPRSAQAVAQHKDDRYMHAATDDLSPDSVQFEREAPRILRRLCEKGAVLAVALDMEKAVVVRDGATGSSMRTAVVDRHIAEAMALQDWISADTTGRITRYRITAAGRTALTDILAGEEEDVSGMAEAAAPFADQHRTWGEREVRDPDTGERRRVRYNMSESP